VTRLTDAVRERFEPLLTNTVATAATALDQRYKLTFFPRLTLFVMQPEVQYLLLHLKCHENQLPRLLSNHKHQVSVSVDV